MTDGPVELDEHRGMAAQKALRSAGVSMRFTPIKMRSGLASALTRAQHHAWIEALAPSSGSIG
jgi:hypothetical protein